MNRWTRLGKPVFQKRKPRDQTRHWCLGFILKNLNFIVRFELESVSKQRGVICASQWRLLLPSILSYQFQTFSPPLVSKEPVRTSAQNHHLQGVLNTGMSNAADTTENDIQVIEN